MEPSTVLSQSSTTTPNLPPFAYTSPPPLQPMMVSSPSLPSFAFLPNSSGLALPPIGGLASNNKPPSPADNTSALLSTKALELFKASISAMNVVPAEKQPPSSKDERPVGTRRDDAQPDAATSSAKRTLIANTEQSGNSKKAEKSEELSEEELEKLEANRNNLLDLYVCDKTSTIEFEPVSRESKTLNERITAKRSFTKAELDRAKAQKRILQLATRHYFDALHRASERIMKAKNKSGTTSNVLAFQSSTSISKHTKPFHTQRQTLSNKSSKRTESSSPNSKTRELLFHTIIHEPVQFAQTSSKSTAQSESRAQAPAKAPSASPNVEQQSRQPQQRSQTPPSQQPQSPPQPHQPYHLPPPQPPQPPQPYAYQSQQLQQQLPQLQQPQRQQSPPHLHLPQQLPVNQPQPHSSYQQNQPQQPYAPQQLQLPPQPQQLHPLHQLYQPSHPPAQPPPQLQDILSALQYQFPTQTLDQMFRNENSQVIQTLLQSLLQQTQMPTNQSNQLINSLLMSPQLRPPLLQTAPPLPTLGQLPAPFGLSNLAPLPQPGYPPVPSQQPLSSQLALQLSQLQQLSQLDNSNLQLRQALESQISSGLDYQKQIQLQLQQNQHEQMLQEIRKQNLLQQQEQLQNLLHQLAANSTKK
eukprot:TRINITY_DN1019_c0_g1_i3.p1 TRINITY_DN1019_c0_g1~~TRINITY_DN1019_c0_g1_i3.p1  ORF type:complete len:641 (-),score=117.38 TRINITY_DN1019_c0_g1_i3:97-2019(-)